MLWSWARIGGWVEADSDLLNSVVFEKLLGFGLLMTLFLLLGFVPQIADLFDSLRAITSGVIKLCFF